MAGHIRYGSTVEALEYDGETRRWQVVTTGFPNFFMLLGPNTGLGHNSVVFMIEVQIQHIMSCLRLLAEHPPGQAGRLPAHPLSVTSATRSGLARR